MKINYGFSLMAGLYAGLCAVLGYYVRDCEGPENKFALSGQTQILDASSDLKYIIKLLKEKK